MSEDSEKKFVMKHVFNDVKGQLIEKEHGADMNGPIEEHFGVEWKLRLYNHSKQYVRFHLECLHSDQSNDWSIETGFQGFACGKKIGRPYSFVFSKNDLSDYTLIDMSEYNGYSLNNTILVEFHVTIKKMTGIKEKEKKKLKHFDDDEAKKHSEVLLKLGDQKFFVHKSYLSSHSSYFAALFSENFAESQKSEIELKDIDPKAFQYFLELIYGYSLVESSSVIDILKLADFFDAPCATQRCEEFLLNRSEQPLKFKFHAAIKYGLHDLKKQCISQMNKDTDFLALSPENADDFSPSVWKMLFDKAFSYR